MPTDDITPDAAPTVRQCASCAAPMEGHQDWCLECGTAAPGRLGGLRPGLRAVSATLALTLLLVGGAGAASYAALSSDANREAIAAVPADGAPVAQAPPAVPAPPAPTIPAPVAPEPVDPPAETPATELPDTPAVTPSPPDDSSLAQVTPPPASTPGTSGSSSRSGDDADEGDDAGADEDAGAGEDPDAGVDEDADKPAEPKAEPIALAAGSVAVYDPRGRATPTGDPGAAIDDDLETTFSIAAPDDGKPLQVGVVVDLGSVKQVRGVELTSPTTGGKVEVYAADGSALPPDIADTRWGDPVSRADIAKTERVLFPRGGSTYRYVTLWFTTPPDGERAAGLTELKVLG